MTGCVLMLINNGHVLVSREDYSALKEFSWTIYGSRGHHYAMTRMDRGDRYERIAMHRLLDGTPPGFVVDHINGDGTDNRRENLRRATYAQNAANRRPVGESAYKGVKRIGDQWAALVMSMGTRKYLGRFETEVEAARAYNVAAQEAHGEFAYLNDVPAGDGNRAATKVVGFSWHSKHQRFIASYQGRFLGYFDTSEDARNAYLAAKSGTPIERPRRIIVRANKSGYRGVSWCKSAAKWLVTVTENGKSRRVGTFLTKESAALAYNEAAKRAYGERAVLNLIPDAFPAHAKILETDNE